MDPVGTMEKQQQVERYTSMGRAAGGNRNNRLVWEGNENKTRLNMGAGVGMEMNKSAQSNLGTGPRRGSCARRWLA